jgi:integrase
VSDVSVNKKGNGKWEVRWRDAAGRRRGRTIDMRRDADRFATEIRRQQQVGDVVNIERGKVLLADFVVEYWRDYAIPNLAPRTRDVYGRVWEKHLRPRIGSMPLRQLTTPTLTRLRAELSRDGAGDPTVLKAFTMLQSLLSHAVVEGHLDHNPARPVRKPRQVRERKVDPVPPELVERMRADFLHRGDRGSALIVCLIAYGGLRTLSEIRELELRDVGAKAMRVNARKTHRMRTVDLLRPLADDLAVWIDTLPSSSPTAPVVPRFDGKALLETDWRNWRRRIYRPAALRVGLIAPRPYDLRHSFVSLLIWEGRSVAEVAEQAGHSVETCSRDYVHVFKEYDAARRVTAAEQIVRARASIPRRSEALATRARDAYARSRLSDRQLRESSRGLEF